MLLQDGLDPLAHQEIEKNGVAVFHRYVPTPPGALFPPLQGMPSFDPKRPVRLGTRPVRPVRSA